MKAIHKLILEKKKEGCTIFLTTHNMEEAAKLCDTVALLNEGRIIEIGRPSDICLKYNHKKKIIVHLTTGEDVELSHCSDSAEISVSRETYMVLLFGLFMVSFRKKGLE